MPWQPGESGNPGGRGSHGVEALASVQRAIKRGIREMRKGGKKTGKKIGVVRLAEKITEALELDPIRTLKALSAYMPKNVSIDLTSNKEADALTDGELARLIADQAAKKIAEEPESIDELLH